MEIHGGKDFSWENTKMRRFVKANLGSDSLLTMGPFVLGCFKKFYHLLSDTDHAIAKAYGVWGEKTMYGKNLRGSSGRLYCAEINRDKFSFEVLPPMPLFPCTSCL